jgi:metallo-beta-lactamase family protein
MIPKITFFGGAGTVTGSNYLLEADGKRILLDCGLFQGFKQLRLRNWTPFPVPADSVDAVVLSHAHLDHSGRIPLLVKQGFKGRVYATDATRDLCAILLPDSGHLQEKDAEFANRHGFSKHKPALPLYTLEEAERALSNFRAEPFEQVFRVAVDFDVKFHFAGHILGAAIVEIHYGSTSLVFSGDLGRPNDYLLPNPARIAEADYLLVESTYGDRLHEARDPEDALAEIINRTVARGGSVLIPSFAVGRAQALLYHLYELKMASRIPNLPIFLDSPMAIDASTIFRAHPEDHKLNPAEVRNAFAIARYLQTPEESKTLNSNVMPKVIISASGMATGGRVLHHLEHMAPDRRNTILFAGFQAGGTRGAAMTAGARQVKIHGHYVPVNAEVDNLHMLSAHADANEIMGWLKGFAQPPKKTFLVHGEPVAADALRHRIEEELHWNVEVPEYKEEAMLA